MKAKKIFTDQPTINKTQREVKIKAQLEAHALNTYNNLQETSQQIPIFNLLKTFKKDFKQFIDKEELNQVTFLKIKDRHMITVIQHQDIDNTNNKQENSQHFTKGSSENFN